MKKVYCMTAEELSRLLAVLLRKGFTGYVPVEDFARALGLGKDAEK